MKVSGFWKRIKTKIENLPPSGKFILKGARHGGFSGYTLSTIYTLCCGGLFILGSFLILILFSNDPLLETVAILAFGAVFLWIILFGMFVIPATLFGAFGGSITAMVLYFFYERIELTALRAIILTTAFWSPLALLRSVLAMPHIIEIGTDPFIQWLFLHIPGMIFLLGMGYVGFKLWNYCESLEQTAGEDCQ